jgi:hypothetical protein
MAVNSQIVVLWIRQSDNWSDKKVKEKVKVKFTQEQTTKAQSGSRGIALLFL